MLKNRACVGVTQRVSQGSGGHPHPAGALRSCRYWPFPCPGCTAPGPRPPESHSCRVSSCWIDASGSPESEKWGLELLINILGEKNEVEAHIPVTVLTSHLCLSSYESFTNTQPPEFRMAACSFPWSCSLSAIRQKMFLTSCFSTPRATWPISHLLTRQTQPFRTSCDTAACVTSFYCRFFLGFFLPSRWEWSRSWWFCGLLLFSFHD